MEAIWVIQQKRGAVRCVDISEQLQVTKPSVSRAIKELAKGGYLMKDENGTISLTGTGEQTATMIYERHRFFKQQLIDLGVDPKTAETDACRMDAPLPELMDRKKRDIMERKGDKEDENKRQKQQKESSAAAL